MMSQSSQENLQKELGELMRVLKRFDGQFVLTDEEGNEFVIMGLEKLRELQGHQQEAQLSFADVRYEAVKDEKPQAAEQEEEDVVSHDVDEVERVNREFASAFSDEHEEYDDLGIEEEPEAESSPDLIFRSNEGRPTPPPVRVRFEPIGEGELSEELQE